MSLMMNQLKSTILDNRVISLIVAGLWGIGVAVILSPYLDAWSMNDTLRSSLILLALGHPILFVLWLFRTHDAQASANTSADTSTDNSADTSTDTSAFFESVRLLTTEDSLSKKIALGQLAFLKTKTSFDKEKIDFVTKGLSISNTSLKNIAKEEDDTKEKENFENAFLSNLDLSKANLANLNLAKANLQNTNLCGACIKNTDLKEANLQGAKLAVADLQHANLSWADLQKADLTWAKLQNTDLAGAKLQKADLRGAELNGADITYADLGGTSDDDRFRDTKWEGAIYNERTKLPDGLNTRREKMVHKDDLIYRK